jgi:hypothetical protein
MPAKSRSVSYRSVFTVTSRVLGDFPDTVSVPVNTTVSLTSTRSDGGSNPAWKQRIKAHTEVTSSLSGTLLRVSRNPITGFMIRDMQNSDGFTWTRGIRVPFRGYTINTRVTGSPAASTIQSQLAETIAIKKFHRKVNGLTQDFQGLVFLGELRETLKMLRNPFEQLRKAAKKDYLDALQRRKKSDPRNWTKAISGTWLEFMFGVQPLLSDIESASNAWSRLNWDPLLLKRIKVSASDTEQQNAPTDHFWSTTAGLVFTGQTKQYKTKKVIYRALWARSRTTPEDLSTKNRAFDSLGIGFREFVPAAWELLPWSFLVDYVTNIGDVLEQTFTSFADIRYIVGTRVDSNISESVQDYSELHTRFNNTNAGVKYIKGQSSGPAKLKVERISFQRNAIPTNSFPINGFQWELPSNPLKYANVLALGLQADSLYPQRSKVWR